jgi:hypothetical protein
MTNDPSNNQNKKRKKKKTHKNKHKNEFDENVDENTDDKQKKKKTKLNLNQVVSSFSFFLLTLRQFPSHACLSSSFSFCAVVYSGVSVITRDFQD